MSDRPKRISDRELQRRAFSAGAALLDAFFLDQFYGDDMLDAHSDDHSFESRAEAAQRKVVACLRKRGNPERLDHQEGGKP